ncbi:MAG TPA: T9SS type A sorting domain-containing protein [Chitinophagaceae bacterium]|jgi:hypothetical protein
MKTTSTLFVTGLKALFTLFVLVIMGTTTHAQTVVFSENFDGNVQSYTSNDTYTSANCSNYIVSKNTSNSVCGGQFVSWPITQDASGNGKFLFEGTTSGPNYTGNFYNVTLNQTWRPGYSYTIVFKVALGDNINSPNLQPRVNGVAIGSLVTPTRINSWQTLTFVYSPSANIVNPVFSLYNSQSNGSGNDFGVDEISITAASLSAGSLPVTLVNFTAQAQTPGVMLKWNTATEINNDHFEIDRSSDGISFDSIGTVKGAGNSNILKSYSYADAYPMSGTNYYRLKQVDIDGNTQYSPTETVTVATAAANSMSIFPNPASSQFTITLKNSSSQAYVVSLIDLSGKQVFTTGAAAGNNQLHVVLNGKIIPGVYIVKLTSGNETLFSKIIIR